MNYTNIGKKTIEQYTKAFKKQTLKKWELHAFAKLLNTIKWSSPERKQAIENLFSELHIGYGTDQEYKLTAEHTKQGKEYFQRYCFKLNGEVRKGCQLGTRELNIVRKFSHFRFVGFYDHYNNGGYDPFYMIVFRVYNKDGNYFDYSPVHWGDPYIVG